MADEQHPQEDESGKAVTEPTAEPQQTEPLEPSNQAQAPKATSAPNTSKSWALLALFVALGGTGIAGWGVFQGNQILQGLKADLRTQQQFASESENLLKQQSIGLDRINRLESNTQHHQRAIAEQRARLQNLENEIKTLQQQIQALNEQLALQKQPTASQWQLAEIEYLLRMGVEQAELANNAPRALGFLRSAQQQLVQFNEPSFQPVLQQLAKDLLALEQLPQRNLGEWQARLIALQERLADLSRMDSSEPTPIESQGPFWEKILSQFNRAIHIETGDQASFRPLMPAEHQYVINQCMLLLEQAKSALMAGNSDLYQQSIRHTKNLLASKMDTSRTAISALLTALDQVLDVPVSLNIPSVGASLDLFHEIRQRQKAVTQAWLKQGGLQP